MPLIYQGRLNTKTIRSLGRAIQLGNSTLDPVSKSRRLDIRYAWETTDSWTAAAKLLPEDFDGFWIDVAAHADPELVERCVDWVKTKNGGQVSLVCLKADAEAEVSISLKGIGPERYDDQRFEERFSFQSSGRRVRTQALNQPGVMSKPRKVICTSRTRAAYDALDPMVDALRPALGPWLETTGHEVRPKSLQTPPHTAKSWFSTIHSVPNPVGISELHLQPQVLDECLTGLSVETPSGLDEQAEHIWRIWAGGLDTLDVIIIRCMGERTMLLDLIDTLDLYHFHPHQNEHLYGLSTLHYRNRLDDTVIQALSEDALVNNRVADWDIRWSDLEFDLDDQPADRIGRSDSNYLIRTASAKTLDRLVVAVDLDDPRDPSFRGIRRQLASGLGDPLSHESAWEFDGPPLDSPIGRQYAQLTDKLRASLQETLEQRVELPAAPGNPLLNVFGFLSRPKKQTSFLEPMTDAIERSLPGFRYDRKAHVTDRYFVEFVRRSPGGVHLIQIQRGHQPAGFSIRLAVSLIHIPFDDLTPGSGRASPGLVVPLEDLVSERDAYWDLANSSVARRTMEDLHTVLALRARPFFEDAEKALVAFRDNQEEQTT